MASKGVKFKDASGNAVYPCPYYPVGSIYMSVNNINPSNFFGGTWEQIKDKFLLACGTTYKNGATGGEAIHQLTVNEMPIAGMIGVDTGSTAEAWTIGEIKNYPAGSYKIGRTNINKGGHNNMPPYLAVYVWKRTA